MKLYKFYDRQKGLSIIELMVALVVGMVLIAGVLQVFLSSRNTFAVNEAMSRVQENGRFALEFIARNARQAGYTDPNYTGERPYKVIPSGLKCDLLGNVKSSCSANGQGLESDTVSFAFQPPVNSAGQRVDCAGYTVPEGKVVVNSFTVYEESDSKSSLACQRLILGESNPRPFPSAILVEGIDNIQIQYGINTTTDNSVNKYVSANEVSDWNSVLAIRVAVLANSGIELSPEPQEKEFYLFDSGPFEFNDRKLRKVFTTTIQLKNYN